MRGFILISILFFSVNSFACRPAPIEWNLDLVNLGAAKALSFKKLKIVESKFEISLAQTKVLKYEWIKSDSGYQCHDYEEVSLTYDIKVASPKLGAETVCLCVVEVIVKRGLYKDAPAAIFEVKEVTPMSSE